MEDKIITGRMKFLHEEDGQIEKQIEGIKKRLNGLKEDIAKLNNYRDRWSDFDVAILCWLLAHNPDELEFWREIKL